MNPEQKEAAARRPLKVRGASQAQNIAKWLSQRDVTPNQISILSVLFAALAAAALVAAPRLETMPAFILPTLAALLIQCRLLCNLFDGMVAVEGGKGTKSGELFNDIPDRFADPIIIVSIGFAIGSPSWTIHLAWFAGILSVMTAYVRTLAASLGAPTDFRGPMAKQHRMATVTTASIIWGIERTLWGSSYALIASLGIIALGCLLTIGNRTIAAYKSLEG